jgi:hypothetical protein
MMQKLFAGLVVGILGLALLCSPTQRSGVLSSAHAATALPGLIGEQFARAFALHHQWGSDLPEQEQETIRKSFSMNAASTHRTLEVDNVFGSIAVTGGPSSDVQLVVYKTIRAESKAKLEEARKQVILAITQDGDSLRFYVDGPFRCQGQNGVRFHEDEGYSVKMDFEIQVPRNIEVTLKTVNEGRIHVRSVTGNFVVRNVNGEIEMQDIAGSGRATTVNGPVKVSFRENPSASSEFSTINGNVELRFQRNLSADFRFKTFNGGIYSDFAVTSLPVHAIQQERRGAKVVFRADRFTGGRIGSGGPEIKLENLNGDLRILENHE